MTTATDAVSARMEAEDVVVRMFVATDEQDWPAVEACFTDPFVLDMTSLAGGSPTTLMPRQVTAIWADGFRTLDHVHHQVGNFRTRIDEGLAQVRCYGVALHHRENIAASAKTRMFVGTYDINLVLQAQVWRIALLRFNLKFIDGNRELDKAT